MVVTFAACFAQHTQLTGRRTLSESAFFADLACIYDFPPWLPFIHTYLAGLHSDPYAQCYGGHQFGQWAGQLGDGRAITLGEVWRHVDVACITGLGSKYTHHCG